jgi:phthiodiolone/phenolphthiodiolone dimycocerosates ketoreductase
MRKLVSRFAAGGVDSFWWPDHLMAFASPSLWQGEERVRDLLDLHAYADPFVCMAACAAEAGDADMGLCVTDSVRRMPATILQSALSVDHLVTGRVLVGIGAGEVANFRPYGWDVASPARRLLDAATSIRSLMDDPGPDRQGAVMGLRPSAGAGPELWLASHGPRGLALTGRVADGWIPSNLTPERWRRGREAVLASAEAAGRATDAVEMGLALDVIVQEQHEQAHALLRHPAVRVLCLLLPDEVFARYGTAHPLGDREKHSLIPTLSGDRLLRAAMALDDRLVHDHIVHGSPNEVAASIAAYAGLEHVRLSDLSSSGGARGGGVDQLLRVVQRIHHLVPPDATSGPPTPHRLPASDRSHSYSSQRPRR